MENIDLHGLSLAEAKDKLEKRLTAALDYGERVVRVIHGQGKHSEYFPVIKSHVRQWLESSEFALEHVESVFRGEDGSPYTSPNAGETVVVLRVEKPAHGEEPVDWEEEEGREARKMAKGMRADRLRTARRAKPGR